ncbi:MAG: redoxin domain-containing protein [Gammaproteobacteria bacterium]|nr:redoxin domain-containing protein [Gammaproteobacteria bacterium]
MHLMKTIKSLFFSVLLIGLCAQVLAQSTPAADNANLISKEDAASLVEPASAAREWAFLRASIQDRFQNGNVTQALLETTLEELKAFTATHENTPEASFALLNLGMIALELGLEELAESSFRQVAESSADPAIHAQAQHWLAQMSLQPGKIPPGFNAKTVKGTDIALKDYRGKVVLIDFWATWCMPCIAELPNLQQTYLDYHDDGFDIISISLDQNRSALSSFLDQRKLPWTQVADIGREPDNRLGDKYGVASIPFMILVGRDGRIVAINPRGPALAKAVTKALEESAHSP